MIDQVARDGMATALRQLLARQISNDEFEALVWSLPTEDPVVRPIESRAWTLYDDLREHRLERELSKAMGSEVARWILFLQAGHEYRWPRGPLDRFPIRNWPVNLLTFGWWGRRKARLLAAWEAHGDVAVWPFLELSELDAARADPRFLVGSSSPSETANPASDRP